MTAPNSHEYNWVQSPTPSTHSYQAGLALSRAFASPSTPAINRGPTNQDNSQMDFYPPRTSTPHNNHAEDRFSPPRSPSPETPTSAMGSAPQKPSGLFSQVFLDSFSKDFGLDSLGQLNLELISQALQRNTRTTDATCWLVISAQISSLRQSVSRIEQRQKEDAEARARLEADLGEQLGNFQLTDTQKKNARIYIQEALYNAARTKFHRIADDVMERIETNKDSNGFGNVFKEHQPVRKAALATFVGRESSLARNTFRRSIEESVASKSYQTLQKFTLNCANKYIRGHNKLASQSEKVYLFKNALLRRFVLKDPEVVITVPVSNEGMNVDGHQVNDTAQPAPSRTQGGRTKKGDDWWSLFDTWFGELIKKYGKDITSDAWKGYIMKIMQMDQVQFRGSEQSYDEAQRGWSFAAQMSSSSSQMPGPLTPFADMTNQSVALGGPVATHGQGYPTGSSLRNLINQS